jgi:PAS domain S-box-containing protein
VAKSFVSRLPSTLQPLSRRLPLLVVAIVGAMMATVVYLGYARVQGLTVNVAEAHLEAASTQLRSSFQQATARVRREASLLAQAPALGRATSAFASDADRAGALAVLQAELNRGAQTAAVALWSADGKLLLAAGDSTVANSNSPRWPVVDEPSDTSAAQIAPLVAQRDSIYINVVGRVRDVVGRTTGYIVVSRRTVRNPQTLALLYGMVGPEARIRLGNNDGKLWSDFSNRVDGLEVRADSGSGKHLDPNGEQYLHSIEPIPNAPWSIMVEIPMRSVTAAAGNFILGMVAVLAVLIAIGTAILWLTVHRSLRPLEAVTDGVNRLARGDLTSPVPVMADDELGRLAATFNSMATQVQDSAREAAARTSALLESNRELLESEERYRVLVDHLPDGIVVHHDQMITYANRASAVILGVADERELIGCSLLDLVEFDEREVFAAEIARIQDSGERRAMRQVRFRRQKSKPVIAEATSMRLSFGGESAVQTILHDVTQRHTLEEQLRQAQKMDAVGRLAGGVAHDFNNILTVIDAHAEFAMQPDADASTRLEDVSEIRKASASAARLTKQLLAFSRKQALSPQQLDLNATVKNLTTMLSRLIGEGVTLTTDLSEALWLVMADAGHMEQVILNLAVNARDAMPSGGILRFRTANLRVGPDYHTSKGDIVPPGDYVLLVVEDTGAGMSEEVQSKVFDPFFTTKQPGQGTGLGLATVYGIVKQSGGHIWLYSEVGRGTSFKILLPRNDSGDEVPSMARTSEHRIMAMQACVLVVEDQEAVRLVVSRALRGAGFVVAEAANAEEAEQLLGATGAPRVDIIVTDMMMPGKSGADLASSPLVVERGIPVIIMSGYSEEFTNREWRLPPNVSFMDKPVSPSDLIRMIGRLVD